MELAEQFRRRTNRRFLLTLLREIFVTAVALFFATIILRYTEILDSGHDENKGLTVNGHETARPIKVGQRFSVTNTTFASGRASVILITSPACPYCLKSEAFHHSLYEAARKSDVTVFVAVPQKPNARAYLAELHMPDANIIEWQSIGTRFSGTPTVVLVDHAGAVLHVWVGKVGRKFEQNVIDVVAGRSVRNDALDLGVPSLTSADLISPKYNKMPNLKILDVRTREEFRLEHEIGAVNIPIDELRYRAQYDLRQSDLNVIDCSGITLAPCRSAIKRLQHREFANLAVLNADADSQVTCTLGKSDITVPR